MAQDHRTYENEWTDTQQEGDTRQSPLRLGLGLLVLSIVAGYGLTQVTYRGNVTEFDLLLISVGGVLGSALVGEYLSPRCRTTSYRYRLLPAIIFITTLTFLVFSIGAAYSGRTGTTIVSTALLMCGFLAILLTAPERLSRKSR